MKQTGKRYIGSGSNSEKEGLRLKKRKIGVTVRIESTNKHSTKCRSLPDVSHVPARSRRIGLLHCDHPAEGPARQHARHTQQPSFEEHLKYFPCLSWSELKGCQQWACLQGLSRSTPFWLRIQAELLHSLSCAHPDRQLSPGHCCVRVCQVQALASQSMPSGVEALAAVHCP